VCQLFERLCAETSIGQVTTPLNVLVTIQWQTLDDICVVALAQVRHQRRRSWRRSLRSTVQVSLRSRFENVMAEDGTNVTATGDAGPCGPPCTTTQVSDSCPQPSGNNANSCCITGTTTLYPSGLCIEVCPRGASRGSVISRHTSPHGHDSMTTCISHDDMPTHGYGAQNVT
jgi:hypothetical protein